jgi:hypothetical protein
MFTQLTPRTLDCECTHILDLKDMNLMACENEKSVHLMRTNK